MQAAIGIHKTVYTEVAVIRTVARVTAVGVPVPFNVIANIDRVIGKRPNTVAKQLVAGII